MNGMKNEYVFKDFYFVFYNFYIFLLLLIIEIIKNILLLTIYNDRINSKMPLV